MPSPVRLPFCVNFSSRSFLGSRPGAASAAGLACAARGYRAAIGGRRTCRQRLIEAVFEPEWEDVPPELKYTRFRDASAKVRVVELTLKLNPDISERDARSLLVEYARNTCKEEGVLRCDVVRRHTDSRTSINVRGCSSNSFGEFIVWIVFENLSARGDHERTTHANRLRLMLDHEGRATDNAVELTTLARHCQLYKTIWPGAVNGWRSVAKYSEKLTRISADDSPEPILDSFDFLVSNSSLEDAVILVASASASRDDYADSVKTLCKKFMRSLLPRDGTIDGVVRAGILTTVGAPRSVTLIIVRDRREGEDIRFDPNLAAELLDEDGWKVEIFVSVFPNLSGWRVASLNDYTWNTPGVEDGELSKEEDEFYTRMRVGDAYKLTQRQEFNKLVARRLTQALDSSTITSGAQASDIDRPLPIDPNRNRIGSPGHEVDPGARTVAPRNDAVKTPAAKGVIPAGSSSPPFRNLPKGKTARLHQLRVIQGNGAFGDVEQKMRDICGLRSDTVMRVMAVSGWNEARLQPLVMELDQGMDAGRISFRIGVNVYGATATLAKVGEGVSAARDHRSDIIVAFGGGAVMDTAKAIAAMVKLGAADVANALSAIRTAAENGQTSLELILGRSAAPLLLIPGTVGSGAEVSEQAILNANLGDRSTRRIAVSFDYAKAPRMAIIDPRLVIPRRANSRDVAMGGLQSLCFAIETLLCKHAPKQAIELAERAILRGRDAVLRARREPESSDGPARHALVDAATFAALSREACGGLGIATSLSLALLDNATETSICMDAPLRTVLPRVLSALLLQFYADDVPCAPASIVLDKDDARGTDLSLWLLRLAEDIGVPLVAAVGVHDGGVAGVVESALSGGLLSHCTDPRLMNADALRTVVTETTMQRYEL